MKPPKTTVVRFRCTPADLELVKRAAAARHLDPASWIRQTLLCEASRVLGPVTLYPAEVKP